MAIKYSPKIGALLLCDYRGSMSPEMDKKRPVVVLASVSDRLCVVVPLSTTEPCQKRSWHYHVYLPDPLPAPYDSEYMWAKCDMVSVVSYTRLQIPHRGKNADNKRIYDNKNLKEHDLKEIKKCIAAVLSI